MLTYISFKHKLPPAEQLSKVEEETSLVLEKANDLKPDILKSGVEDISCSTESLLPATTEETGETIIHEYDHKDVAYDVDEGPRDKKKTGTVAGVLELSENTRRACLFLSTIILLPPIHQNQWHSTSVITNTSA